MRPSAVSPIEPPVPIASQLDQFDFRPTPVGSSNYWAATDGPEFKKWVRIIKKATTYDLQFLQHKLPLEDERRPLIQAELASRGAWQRQKFPSATEPPKPPDDKQYPPLPPPSRTTFATNEDLRREVAELEQTTPEGGIAALLSPAEGTQRPARSGPYTYFSRPAKSETQRSAKSGTQQPTIEGVGAPTPSIVGSEVPSIVGSDVPSIEGSPTPPVPGAPVTVTSTLSPAPAFDPSATFVEGASTGSLGSDSPFVDIAQGLPGGASVAPVARVPLAAGHAGKSYVPPLETQERRSASPTQVVSMANRARKLLFEQYKQAGRESDYPGGKEQFKKDYYAAFPLFAPDPIADKPEKRAPSPEVSMAVSSQRNGVLQIDPKILKEYKTRRIHDSDGNLVGLTIPPGADARNRFIRTLNASTVTPTTFVQTLIQNLKGLSTAGGGGIPGLMATNMETVAAREAQLKKYLGSTDYDKQLQDATNLAKFQAALAVAQRGFASAGAAPRRGESPASTVSRELMAPIAGDLSPIATRLIEQRRAAKTSERQEDRQLKLAALQDVKAEDKARLDLALALTPKPKTTAAGKLGLDPYVVVSRDDENNLSLVKEEGGNAAIQVRQGSVNGVPILFNIKSEDRFRLGPGQEIMKLSEFAKGTGTGEKAANAGFMQRTEYPYEYQHVVRRGYGKGAYFSLSGEDVPQEGWEWVGNTIPTDKTTKKPDAERKRENNRNFLFTSMNDIQDRQLQGTNTPFSARSALFFDLAAYRKGDFAFRYIPPDTNPLEAAAKSIPITNTEVQEFITTKVNSLADATLQTDFGSANQQIKSDRLNDAVKAVLSLPATTLFGASEIPNLGTDSNNRVVGYSPKASAFDPAVQKEAIKSAVDSLRQDAAANPRQMYAQVQRPASKEFLNTIPGRVKIATMVFPDAFGAPQVPGTDSYDSGVVQRRRDIEAAIPRSTLVIGASDDDYRKVLADRADNISAARDTLQNSKGARDAKDAFLLFGQFRQGLIEFKNAARESNVEGFATGRLAAGLSRIGLAKFVSEEGAEHWRRLTAASDRFQEGISRRVGKDFGDDRISNKDADAYQKLVADIKKGEGFNRILIEDGLSRIKNNMTDLMSRGGRVGWTKRDLRQAAEAGVDFSDLETLENWHGHGYYGKDRYAVTRQRTPSLSPNQWDIIRTQGQLKDTMYGGQYTVPDVNYLTDEIPTFERGREKTDQGAAVEPTRTLQKGPLQFERYIKALAKLAKVDEDVMRKRVVRGIISYNIFRDQVGR